MRNRASYGSQLSLAANVSRCANETPKFIETMDILCTQVGQPETLLVNAGFAVGHSVEILDQRGIELLVANGRDPNQRTYD